MYLLAAGVLTILFAVFLVWPHLTESSVNLDEAVDSELNALLDEKERVLRTIKDLELDFQMGKISPDDHTMMKHRGAQELAQVLTKIDAHFGSAK